MLEDKHQLYISEVELQKCHLILNISKMFKLFENLYSLIELVPQNQLLLSIFEKTGYDEHTF